MVIVLRIYLVLVFLANLGGLTNLAISLDAITLTYPKLSHGLVALLFACGLASLAAVVLLWHWRRTGIYLIVAAYAVMLLVNRYYEAPLAHTVLGPAGLAILFALLWPVGGRLGEKAGGRPRFGSWLASSIP